jgi:hypothetical protein
MDESRRSIALLVLAGVLACLAVALVVTWSATRPTERRLRSRVRGCLSPVDAASNRHVSLSDEFPVEIDGVPVGPGSRVALAAQHLSTENGVYVLTKDMRARRAKDMSRDAHVVVGTTLFVRRGVDMGGVTLTVQAQDGDGASYQGVSVNVQFVRAADEPLGEINRRPGHVLVCDDESPTGVSWSSVEELTGVDERAPDVVYDGASDGAIKPGARATVSLGHEFGDGERHMVIDLDGGETSMVCRVVLTAAGPAIASTTQYGRVKDVGVQMFGTRAATSLVVTGSGDEPTALDRVTIHHGK